MKKIFLKTEACIGCGACVAVDDSHFKFSEDGYSEITNQNDLDNPSLLDAIEACPVGIISLEEVTEDKNDISSDETCECNQDGTCDCNKECSNPNCDCNPCTCEDCDCQDTENIKK